jgi:hypothetical protein
LNLKKNWTRNQNQNQNQTLTQESELDSRPRLNWDWVSKREKDVELSDFSSFENHPTPFCYICPRFVYKNKAHKDEEEEREKALHEYKERSRNLTVCICFSRSLNFASFTLLISVCFCTALRCYPCSTQDPNNGQ